MSPRVPGKRSAPGRKNEDRARTSMKATARQLRIRELLERQEFVDLATLCRHVEGSEATVRRDLIALEKEGMLKRVHGGALATGPGDRGDFAWLSSRMPAEKRRIAEAAALLVEDGQTLILDGGSTVAAVARQLLDRSLHVVTNSLRIAGILEKARRVDVTLTGGYLHSPLGILLGPFCEQMLGSLAADVVIMGIGGVTEEGFSNNNTLVVGSKRKMIEVARKVVVVADHTKFGRAAMVPVAPLDAADVIVSDAALSPAHQGKLRSRGIEVRLG